MTLKLKFTDFQLMTRAKSLPRAVEGKAEFARLSREILDEVLPLPMPVRLMGLTLSALEGNAERRRSGRMGGCRCCRTAAFYYLGFSAPSMTVSSLPGLPAFGNFQGLEDDDTPRPELRGQALPDPYRNIEPFVFICRNFGAFAGPGTIRSLSQCFPVSSQARRT